MRVTPVVVLSAAIGAVLLYIPIQMGWSNLNVLQSEADEIVSQAQDFNDKTQKVSDQVISVPENFEKRSTAAQAAVPESSEIPEIIDQLSEKAKLSGLIWVSGTPSTVDPTQGLGSAYELNFSLRGADETVVVASATSKFLDSIRDLDRLLVADNISINNASNTASMTLKFFSQEKTVDNDE